MNKRGRRIPPAMPPAKRAAWDLEDMREPPLPAVVEVGVAVTVTVVGEPGVLVDVESELVAKEGCEQLSRDIYLGFTLS
jgi:hypothetical protein